MFLVKESTIWSTVCGFAGAMIAQAVFMMFGAPITIGLTQVLIAAAVGGGVGFILSKGEKHPMSPMIATHAFSPACWLGAIVGCVGTSAGWGACVIAIGLSWVFPMIVLIVMLSGAVRQSS